MGDQKPLSTRRLSSDMFPDDMQGKSDESSATAFFGALEEQTRTLLDQIDFVGNSFGWDSHIPSVAKAGVGGLSFLTNVADCVSRADGNDVKEELCPVHYASAAFDSISAIDNMLGIDNGELGLDEQFDGSNKHGKSLWDSMLGSSSASSGSSNFLNGLAGSSPAAAPAPTGGRVFDWS